jgi:hypothetical protein
MMGFAALNPAYGLNVENGKIRGKKMVPRGGIEPPTP